MYFNVKINKKPIDFNTNIYYTMSDSRKEGRSCTERLCSFWKHGKKANIANL